MIAGLNIMQINLEHHGVFTESCCGVKFVKDKNISFGSEARAIEGKIHKNHIESISLQLSLIK